jgi:hypothetical protein
VTIRGIGRLGSASGTHVPLEDPGLRADFKGKSGEMRAFLTGVDDEKDRLDFMANLSQSFLHCGALIDAVVDRKDTSIIGRRRRPVGMVACLAATQDPSGDEAVEIRERFVVQQGNHARRDEAAARHPDDEVVGRVIEHAQHRV